MPTPNPKPPSLIPKLQLSPTDHLISSFHVHSPHLHQLQGLHQWLPLPYSGAHLWVGSQGQRTLALIGKSATLGLEDAEKHSQLVLWDLLNPVGSRTWKHNGVKDLLQICLKNLCGTLGFRPMRVLRRAGEHPEGMKTCQQRRTITIQTTRFANWSVLCNRTVHTPFFRLSPRQPLHSRGGTLALSFAMCGQKLHDLLPLEFAIPILCGNWIPKASCLWPSENLSSTGSIFTAHHTTKLYIHDSFVSIKGQFYLRVSAR